MNREDAEEWAQTLAHSMDSQWRWIALAKKKGVPQALGMNVKQFVIEYLGGYTKLEPEQKQQAVQSLVADGLNNTAIADTIGLDESSVRRAKKKLEDSANAEVINRNANEINGRDSANAGLADPGETIKAIHKKFDEAIQAENKAHKARVAAGEMLIELQSQVNEDWWAWYEKRFVRTKSEGKKAMDLAKEGH